MTDSTDNARGPERIWHAIDRRGKIEACPDAHVQPCDDVASAYVKYRRADLSPDPLAVKVKPLEWEDFDGRGAKTSAFYNANYLINLWNGCGQFEVSLSYPGHQTGYDGERWHDTLEAAKAAAQADYETRIRSALEPCDPLADPRVVALVEALRLAHRRLVWAAGLIANDTARDMAGNHAEETRAALAALSPTGGNADGR